MHDAGELARKTRHATVRPVGIEGTPAIGQQADYAWTVGSDDCDDQ